MQYLTKVRDGSKDTIGNGYRLCEIVGCEVGSNEITPPAQELWSQDAPDFISNNDQSLSLVQRIRKATGGRCIIVYDRGSDRRRLLVPWAQDKTCHYLVRQCGDRHLIYKRKMKSGLELAALRNTPYAETIIKEKDGEEKACFIQYGFYRPDCLSVRIVLCGLSLLKAWVKNH